MLCKNFISTLRSLMIERNKEQSPYKKKIRETAAKIIIRYAKEENGDI